MQGRKVLAVIGWLAAMGTSLVAARSLQAQPGFSLRRVGTIGCTTVVSAPGDAARAYALERAGRIRIIQNGAILPTPYLDISSTVGTGGETGALGLAFDPQFQTNGHFYVCYSPTSATGLPRYVVARFTAASAQALTVNPTTQVLVMPLVTATETPGIHNGGWIGFGPDGYLYISRGEGPRFGQASQDLANIYGKVLRIDVRSDEFPAEDQRNYAVPPTNPLLGTPGAAREVYSMGLRNPYRCSFDRLTSTLWIGDVGTSFEEVNLVEVSDPPLRNFGWPCIDGSRPWPTGTNLCAVASPNYELPAFSPPRSGQAFTATCLIGGYVYRGRAVPAMQGRYLFSPTCYSSRLASLDAANPQSALEHVDFGAAWGVCYGFGEDSSGELYVCAADGLYKMMPPIGTFTDCNNNALVDALEIADGLEPDVNADGIPDTCTRLCAADIDASGTKTVGDLFFFLNLWFNLLPAADINTDGQLSVQDIFDYLGLYFGPCP